MIWTTHAKQRRKQMGVTEHQVERAITDPDATYPDADHDDRTLYQRGSLVVVVRESADWPRTVVTILAHGAVGRDDDGRPLFAVTPLMYH